MNNDCPDEPSWSSAAVEFLKQEKAFDGSKPTAHTMKFKFLHKDCHDFALS